MLIEMHFVMERIEWKGLNDNINSSCNLDK
jgi:hypothetical protein